MCRNLPIIAKSTRPQLKFIKSMKGALLCVRKKSNALRAEGGVAGPREGEEEGEERVDDPPLTSPATDMVGKTSLSGRAYKPTGAMEAEDTANTWRSLS